MEPSSVGINGFGRFGLHLLRYWLINYKDARFSIDFINDEGLDLDKLKDIIKTDPLFAPLGFNFTESFIIVTFKNGNEHKIAYTNQPVNNVEWLGKPSLFFECSGKYSEDKKQLNNFIKGNTHTVLVSATSSVCDQTLIYSYNHREYKSSSKLISYGSCTVNAYVPLASFLNEIYGIIESDVNVIHSVPPYKLADYIEPVRTTCTLEKSGPNLLKFLNTDNFKVIYTLVPYGGVSIMDYRFKLKRAGQYYELAAFLDSLSGEGKIYGTTETDSGATDHKFSDRSAIFVKSSTKMVGDNLYLHAYFDNENSVNRYFDLANYIAEKHLKANAKS